MGRQEDARQAWTDITELFFAPETHDRFHDACAAINLPHPGALKLLLRLEAQDPPAMRDLASFMGCDASWVTALVDGLESSGYVERRVAENDRRVKLVQLTEAGADAKGRALEIISTPSKALESLSDAETRTLARITAKLAAR